LSCETFSRIRVDPKRIVSAGLVIRRAVRKVEPGGTAVNEFNTLTGWMRDPTGKYSWSRLSPDEENSDPDPTQRPHLQSGQAALDQQLTALSLASAKTESTTPAFAAPPATCAALHRTVFYGIIPTASSEVSDTPPTSPPSVNRSDLVQSLPPLLRAKKYSSSLTLPNDVPAIDYHWMSDDFLNAQYPPSTSTTPPYSTPSASFNWYHSFATALRMLSTVFQAFDPNSSTGAAILAVLNKYSLPLSDGTTKRMGDYFQAANAALLPTASQGVLPQPTILLMPTSWCGLSHEDEKALVEAMVAALTPLSKSQLVPQGRFQDSTRYYKLRMFFRIKPESGTCPPKLVWSQYSHPFQIAPWHASGPRTPPPIPLPDPTSATFLQGVKPNCSFVVPNGLMNAMQGTTLSGLMKGAGAGGGGVSFNWICGFNIPLITICAFFVLNIFLILLNLCFFWLPIIKICIPFPYPSED
jgi:hypothetical protein